MRELKKIIARTLCFMHQRIFRPIYIFNNYAYFLDFRAQKFPLIFVNLNPFLHQQALHFGVSNYEKQHKEGTCKVLGRSVVFSAFFADFCFLLQISDYHHLKPFEFGYNRAGVGLISVKFTDSVHPVKIYTCKMFISILRNSFKVCSTFSY